MKNVDDKKPESLYLSEDHDLLEELATVGAARDSFAERECQVNEIQIKAILRSRKTADKADKSTSRFSTILIAFTLIQIVVAFTEFLLEAINSEHEWWAVFATFFCAGCTVLILWFFSQELMKDK